MFTRPRSGPCLPTASGGASRPQAPCTLLGILGAAPDGLEPDSGTDSGADLADLRADSVDSRVDLGGCGGYAQGE